MRSSPPHAGGPSLSAAWAEPPSSGWGVWIPGWSLASSLPPTCPQVPLVMKALQRQLKDRSARARQGCFSLLTELAGVLPGSLAEHMPILVAGRVPWNLGSALPGLSPNPAPSPRSLLEPLFNNLQRLPTASSEYRPSVLFSCKFPGLYPQPWPRPSPDLSEPAVA